MGLAAATVAFAGVAHWTPAAQPVTATEQVVGVETWARELWTAASSGSSARFETLLEHAPGEIDAALRETLVSYRNSLAAREHERAEQMRKASEELEAELTKAEAERDLSKALVSAVQLVELAPRARRQAVLNDPTLRRVVEAAAAKAHAHEQRGEWLHANELFYRLNLLFDVEATYKADAERLARRLTMIQLYAPRRMWELRNEHRIASGENPLPPYNAVADNYVEKLRGVQKVTVREALRAAADQHVDRVSMLQIVLGGIDAIETLVTTHDLRQTFPSLADDIAREAFLVRLRDVRQRTTAAAHAANLTTLMNTLALIEQANAELLDLPVEAILHEFAGGATSQLDEFSGVIWPEEVRHFERTTQGNFSGVGIHIMMDELRNIKVHSPLEGTPAFLAGIQPGDVIRSVDGVSTVGMGINQAVELITGPRGTKVMLGIERRTKTEDGEEVASTLEFELTRAQIQVRTVKGWQRTGPKENDWNWFIDEDRGIGYLRIIQFTEATTRELDDAIEQMKAKGLTSLILDLRFNPGGLLSEAISVSDRFLTSGTIVSTQNRAGHVGGRRGATSSAKLNQIPVVVLVNEGSASASEIVSGALQDHASDGRMNAVVLGERTFGKGSVQRVWPLPGDNSAMKLTTEYYLLPKGRKIHRQPGASSWGVEPDFEVDMLPSQIAKALEIRQNADILRSGDRELDIPDPRLLLTEGRDLQLHAAVVLLQARTPPASPLTHSVRENRR